MNKIKINTKNNKFCKKKMNNYIKTNKITNKNKIKYKNN